MKIWLYPTIFHIFAETKKKISKNSYFLKLIYYLYIKDNKMERTKEHNQKIGEAMRRYYARETAEQREQRIAKLKERKRIEKELYERYIKENNK